MCGCYSKILHKSRQNTKLHVKPLIMAQTVMFF